MECALFLHPEVSGGRLGVGRRGKRENLGNGYLQSGLRELIFHSKLKKKSEQYFKAKK